MEKQWTVTGAIRGQIPLLISLNEKRDNKQCLLDTPQGNIQ